MEKITIKGKIEFCDEKNKDYDCEFTAILQDSAAFAYGNRTAVSIQWQPTVSGIQQEPVYLDTRYDRTIKRNEEDFKKWLKIYFMTHYQKNILTFY